MFKLVLITIFLVIFSYAVHKMYDGFFFFIYLKLYMSLVILLVKTV